MMRKFKLFSVFVLLALLFVAGLGAATAQEPSPASSQSANPAVGTPPRRERPRRLTAAQYLDEVADLYAQHPDFEVVIDLEDPVSAPI